MQEIINWIKEYGTVPVILGLFAFLQYQFLKSYFNKKGENLATKEDIEELTKITESIKSEISILSENEIGLNNEVRNAIIEFNNAFAEIHSNAKIEIFKAKNTTEIFKSFYTEAFPKYSFAESKLLLLVTDDRLPPLITKIQSKFLNLVTVNTTHLTYFLKLLEEKQTNENGFLELLDKYSKEATPIHQEIHRCQIQLNAVFREILKKNKNLTTSFDSSSS